MEVADEEVTEVAEEAAVDMEEEEGTVEEEGMVVEEADMVEDTMEVRFFNTHLLFCHVSCFVSRLSATMCTPEKLKKLTQP